MKFITIKTISLSSDSTKESRSVSLAYDYAGNPNSVYLLGSISHNTELVIDQELVDNLQILVNEMPKKEITK